MTTCSTVETQFKEKTIYLHSVIFLCLRCVLSEIVLFHCRNKQVFSEGGFPKRVSSWADILRVLFYSSDVICVFPQISRPDCLWLSDRVNWFGWTGLLEPSPQEGPAIHAHLFAITPMHLVNTVVGRCGHALMCNMLNSSASSCICYYLL